MNRIIFENKEQENIFKKHLDEISKINTLTQYGYLYNKISENNKINNQQKENLQDKLVNFATDKILSFMNEIDVYEWRDSSSINDKERLFEDIKNNNLESYYGYLIDMIVDDEYEESYNEIIEFMENRLSIHHSEDIDKLNESSKGIRVESFNDTFYVIDSAEYNGKKLFLLESENYGDEKASIIVDENSKVIMKNIWNGFDDYIENREDLVRLYPLDYPIDFVNDKNEHIRLTSHYVLPHNLQFIDKENNKYEYYVGTIDGSDYKLFLKTEDDNLVYSPKLDKEYEDEELLLTDNLDVDKYSFDYIGNIKEYLSEEYKTLINNQLLDKYENKGFEWVGRNDYDEKYLNKLCKALKKWEEKKYKDEIIVLLAKAETKYINVDKILENISELNKNELEKEIFRVAGIIDFNELEKMDYVIIDTETTGFAKDDEVIELGIIDKQGKTIYENLFKPTKALNEEAKAVNGITEEELENAPSYISELEKITNLLDGKIVVIFNKEFDTRMLLQTAELHKNEFDNEIKYNVLINKLNTIFDKDTYCAMQSYSEHINSFKVIGLNNALKDNGIDIVQSHRAIDDCKDTLKLIHKCLEKIKEKDYVITPIKEFIKDGIIYTGNEVSGFHIDKNVGIGFADRSRIYNALKDFEEANKDFPNLPTAFNSDGSYEDKEILYSTYDKYIALSHREELQQYEQYFEKYVDYKLDYMKDYNYDKKLKDRYILKLEALAEIYYAKKNGLNEEQINYMIKNANEMQDYFISSTMRTTWKAFQSGLTKEQIEIVNDKEIGIGEREVLFELLSEGGTLEQVKILKGFDYNILYPIKYGFTNNIITVEQGKAICDNLKNLLDNDVYKNNFELGLFAEGLIFYLQKEPKTVMEIEDTFKEFFNQNEEKNFFDFVEKNGWINNEKIIEVNIRYTNEKEVNGWRTYTDVVRFDDLETAMKYVNKTEVVYDWLDNSLPVKEDEIPLSLTVNKEIVWENEEFVNQLINKIKNNDIPKNKVLENIMTLKQTNFINKFDIGIDGFDDEICANKLYESKVHKRVDKNDVLKCLWREYRCYLDYENKEDYWFEFSDSDIDKVFYNNQNIKNYNIKYSKEMQEDIIKINQEPTKNIFTNMLQVIGEYEKLNEIPNDKKITSWFGDYAIYEAKSGIKKNDIIKNYIELEKEIRNTVRLPFCYDYNYDYYDLMTTQLTEKNYMDIITSNTTSINTFKENADIFNYIDDNNLKEYSLTDFYKPLQKNIPVVCVNINKTERYIEVSEKDIEKIRAYKYYNLEEKKEILKMNKPISTNKHIKYSR